MVQRPKSILMQYKDSSIFVAGHRGMFSRLGLTTPQVDKLRDDYGIYMVGDSRFNVAGLPADGLDELAKAIAAVL